VRSSGRQRCGGSRSSDMGASMWKKLYDWWGQTGHGARLTRALSPTIATLQGVILDVGGGAPRGEALPGVRMPGEYVLTSIQPIARTCLPTLFHSHFASVRLMRC